MSILKIKDKDGNWQGITTVQGDKGDPGFSPAVSVAVDSDDVYKLNIETKDGVMTTPNLRAVGGGTGTSASGVLGVIDNFKEFDGTRIPSVKTMQPLECYSLGTKFVFDHEVVMYVYNGDLDINGNVDINKYTRYQGKEIYVPTKFDGFLTDYVIYNPTPKKPNDDWVDPNIIDIKPYLGRVEQVYSGRDDLLTFNEYYPNGNSYTPGTSTLSYKVDYDSVLKEVVVDKSVIYQAVYNSKNKLPRIPIDKLTFTTKSDFSGGYSDPIPMELGDATFETKKKGNALFRKGREYTLYKLGLSCDWNVITGQEDETPYYGVDKLATIAKSNDYSKPNFDMVIGTSGQGNTILNSYGMTSTSPIMRTAVKPNTYYTIECLSGDVGICAGTQYDFITKSSSTNYVYKVDDDGNITVDTSQDPDGTIDIATAFSSPRHYVKKGESLSFQTDFDATMIYIFCYNAEDYPNVKMVEGTIPYSELISERIATGATRFNVKTYLAKDATGNQNDILKSEYNIKLYSTSDENSYCRFLDNRTIDHVNLDDVSMVGHTHKKNEIIDLMEVIPKLVTGTETLEDGVSELESGTFYFVYEGE